MKKIIILLFFIFCLIHAENEVNDSQESENVQNTNDSNKKNETEEISLLEIPAEHLTSIDVENDSKKFLSIKINKRYLKYGLKPLLMSKNKLLCLNAQDLSFYQRNLKKPILTFWILTKRTSRLSYANKRLFETAWSMRIQIKFIVASHLELVISPESIKYKGMIVDNNGMPDIVLARLGAKIDYYSLSILRQFEKMGVLVLNPYESIEISRDKLYTLQHLGAHQMPIPKTMITKMFPLTKNSIESIESEFSYPIVVKKSRGSGGRGVVLVSNRGQLKDLVDMMDASKTPMIVQEFIKRSKGKDIRVIVIGGRAIGAMMRVAKKGFKSNFHQGGFAKKVNLSYELEWLAVEAAKIVGLDVAGVDILMDKNTYKICEINSSPGFEAFELTTGIDVPSKILNFIKLRLGVWGGKSLKKKKKAIQIPVMAVHVKTVEELERANKRRGVTESRIDGRESELNLELNNLENKMNLLEKKEIDTKENENEGNTDVEGNIKENKETCNIGENFEKEKEDQTQGECEKN